MSLYCTATIVYHMSCRQPASPLCNCVSLCHCRHTHQKRDVRQPNATRDSSPRHTRQQALHLLKQDFFQPPACRHHRMLCHTLKSAKASVSPHNCLTVWRCTCSQTIPGTRTQCTAYATDQTHWFSAAHSNCPKSDTLQPLSRAGTLKFGHATDCRALFVCPAPPLTPTWHHLCPQTSSWC